MQLNAKVRNKNVYSSPFHELTFDRRKYITFSFFLNQFQLNASLLLLIIVNQFSKQFVISQPNILKYIIIEYFEAEKSIEIIQNDTLKRMNYLENYTSMTFYYKLNFRSSEILTMKFLLILVSIITFNDIGMRLDH